MKLAKELVGPLRDNFKSSAVSKNIRKFQGYMVQKKQERLYFRKELSLLLSEENGL